MRLVRAFLLAGLAAVTAAAGEGDGATAAIERWAHARGPASNSARSLAWPPDSFGGLRWTYRARSAVAGAPVTWDGVGFLVDGDTLVALDLVDGSVLARTGADRPAAESLCVHDRDVFVVEAAGAVTQYALKGRALKRRWSFAAAGAFAPRILAGEIYVASPDALARLRAGSKDPVWRAPGRFLGPPAVFGDHVYAVRRADDGRILLDVVARADGAVLESLPVKTEPKPGGFARVVASKGIVAVQPPYAGAWSLWRRTLKRGAPVLEKKRDEALQDEPLAGTSMLLARTERPDAWTILRVSKRPRHPVVTRKDRPDLFAGVKSAVSLNGTICFGTWAADLGTNRILWHLDERNDITAFRKGVKFHAVPAGHRQILVVSADGKALHLVVEEEF